MVGQTWKEAARKPMSRRAILRLTGAAAIAAVGSQWLEAGRAEAQGRSIYRDKFKAVLVVSASQKKLAGMAKPQRERLAITMAARIRTIPGVFATQPVLFESWQDPEIPSPPWRPDGCVVFVEAKDSNAVEEAIKAVYAAAKAVDQGMMRLTPIDGWIIR